MTKGKTGRKGGRKEGRKKKEEKKSKAPGELSSHSTALGSPAAPHY
jgi:hypothetical protein